MRIAAIDEFYYLTEHPSPQHRWHHDHVVPLEIGQEVRHFHMQNAPRLQDTHCFAQHFPWIGGVFKHIRGINNIEGSVGKGEVFSWSLEDAFRIKTICRKQDS